MSPVIQAADADDARASKRSPTETITKPAREEETRDRLIEAAAEVFAERGYDGTRVQEIARRAGLTTGAIYANFTGKADLLLEAIRVEGVSELNELMVQDPTPASSIDMLTELGRSLVTEGFSQSRTLVFEAFGAARRDPEVRTLLVAHLERLVLEFRAFMERAQDRGEVDPTLDLDAIVRFCNALALGFMVFEALDIPLPDPGTWTDVIRRVATSIAPAGQRSTETARSK